MSIPESVIEAAAPVDEFDNGEDTARRTMMANLNGTPIV